MKHTRPDKVHEGAEYKKSGSCDNHFDCECKHPSDEAKRDKNAAWKEWNTERYNKRKALREKGATEHQRGSYMVETCGCAAESECRMSSDDDNSASEELDAEDMGRGCRKIKEKQYILERQNAKKLIADTKKNVNMDTDENFSAHELSIDTSVTQSTDGADFEDTEMDISSEETSYTYSGKETSEEIVSDADMDVYADTQVIISELSYQGWQANEIEQWGDWQDSLSDALQKMNIADNMAGEVMDQAPYIRLLYDSGTFTHLVGRGARALMISTRELPKSIPSEHCKQDTVD